MKVDYLMRKAFAITVVIVLACLNSCSENDAEFQDDVDLAASDLLTDSYFEDADDIASLALLSDDGPNTGSRTSGQRQIVISDPRFNCDGVEITIKIHSLSTAEVPKGEIVVNFGDGCTDLAGNVRKGKIIINFFGKRFVSGSVVVTTFEGYSINDISLSGIRTLTNITESSTTAPKFRIELVNGMAKWPDNTQATREHCLVREWKRADNPINDTMEVTQCADADFAAEGVNRRGREYRVIIMEPIVYKRGCPLPVSGVKQIIDVASGKVIIVDYGDGRCDRVITITIDGNVRTITVNRKR